MVYLSKEDWSPRFGADFYTISMETRTIYNSPPSSLTSSTANNNNDVAITSVATRAAPTETTALTSTSTSTDKRYHLKGNNSFPAVYFNISVKCAHQEHTCPRRYSEFRNLYDELRRKPPQLQLQPSPEDELHIPPKTCFWQKVDDEFLDIRQEELFHFMTSILKQIAYEGHPAVISFLELDRFSIKE